MLYSIIRPVFLLTAMLLITPGCSYFRSAESDDPDEFVDLDGEKKGDKSEDGDELARGEGGAEGELELKLKVGDRFPMQKRIDQMLTQFVGQGTTVNRSVVDMTLTLQVEEVRDGSRLLSVQYHQIKYGHNIAGRTVKYDSTELNDRVPTEALVYAGLKGNGFRFWIGPDNRVIELVGFSEFLQRCLRDVPPQYRDAVMRQLESTHNEEGLANFVDDGIGLLPSRAVKVGSNWDLKPRHTERPIPMITNTKCVLRNLTEERAEIGLIGEIKGSNAPTLVSDGNQSMRVLITGGHCDGRCVIDRRTGLPIQSDVNRTFDMTIRMPDGAEIMQQKVIVTSIASFIGQRGPQTPGNGSSRESESNQFIRASGDAIELGPNRVTQASGSMGNTDRRGNSHSNGRSEFERSNAR